MSAFPSSTRRPWRPSPLVVAVVAAAVLGVVAAALPAEPREAEQELATLPPMHAIPVTTDTLLIGGFARGTFGEALRVIASDLTDAEREMVGRHLDKIFVPILQDGALKTGGRLKVAYERTRRPDGTTRSIQVLAAQAAVGGGLHTVYLVDQAEQPGYYGDGGESLDPQTWAGPLPSLRVTSPFRMNRMHPLLGRVLPHTGTDYAAAYGTPVHATADGSVSYAAARGGYGNLIEIQHPNGYATRYAHLSAIAVRPWQPVRQGDVIGYTGMSGLATGPHLHYEVRRKGQPVDPAMAMAYAAAPARVAPRADFNPAYRAERQTLARLLAHAPTVIRRR